MLFVLTLFIILYGYLKERSSITLITQNTLVWLWGSRKLKSLTHMMVPSLSFAIGSSDRQDLKAKEKEVEHLFLARDYPQNIPS